MEAIVEKRRRPGTLAVRLFACGIAVALAGSLIPIPSGYADDVLKTQDDSSSIEPAKPSDGQGDADSVGDGGSAGDGIVENPTDDLPETEGSGAIDEKEPSDDPSSVAPGLDEEDPNGTNAVSGEEAPGDADEGAPDGADANSDGEAAREEADANGEESEQEASTLAEADAKPVQSYAGATMFETAAAEARAAYPQGCSSAVIVGPGQAWIDALSATGLAASKGPILFTEKDSLNSATEKALKGLGVKSVVVIGGTAAVSEKAAGAIKSAGIAVEARLGGADCFDTQMKIYEYGLSKGLWNPSMAIVATASHFGDALSVSPVAYAKKAPVFLVSSGSGLGRAQQQALVKGARGGGFTSIVIVGGTSAVSRQVEGFVSGVCYWNGGSYTRLAGATQYETSAKVATWAAKSQGLSWDNLAFATGAAPYDALAGSVLQGESGSVLLLIDRSNMATLSAASQHKGSIDHVRFLGGTAAVSQSIRNTIISKLEIPTAASPKVLAETDADLVDVEVEAIVDAGEPEGDAAVSSDAERAGTEGGRAE